MTPRQVRAALRSHFNGIGFVEQGSRFVSRHGHLVHAVDVAAVRRLPDTVEIHHHVALSEQAPPLLTKEISSHGHNSLYPRIWAASSVEPSLVLQQVAAIFRAFRTKHDIAHFQSDRALPGHELCSTEVPAMSEPNSLSAAETSNALRKLAQEVMGNQFSMVSGGLGFDLWASRQESEGFRHYAYIEANQSATLANVVILSLPVHVLAGNLRADSAVRALMTAPKQVLFSRGRPVLIPLSAPQGSDCEEARAALAEHVRQNPPHLLPR